MNGFDRHSPIPFTLILNGSNSTLNDIFPNKGNIQIFSSPLCHKEKIEETSQYKIKAAEFETKFRQVEAINCKLNEQLGNAQNEYTDLENKYESLKQADIGKVCEN